MGHINSLEILNLPHTQTNWNIGDKINLDGKNLLLIGENGTGKTTMLEIINDSINRARNLLGGEIIQTTNPLESFADHYESQSFLLGDGEYHERFEDMSDEEIEEEYNDNILAGFESAVSEFYGGGIESIFDSGYQASRMMLEKALVEFKNVLKQQNRDMDDYISKGGSNAMYSPAIIGAFLDGAEQFAYIHDMDVRVVYGNMLMFVKNMHQSIRNDASMWGYVKPNDGDDVVVYANKVILDTSKAKKESLGQRSKRIIKELRRVQNHTLALLDEPTNGVDLGSHVSHVNNIMSLPKKVQTIAASHDPQLFQAVQQSDNWVVYDLGEKII